MKLEDVTILIPIYNNSQEEIDTTISVAKLQNPASIMVYDDGSDPYVASALDRVSEGLVKRFRGRINKGMGAVMNKLIGKVETNYYIKIDCGDIYTSKHSVQSLREEIEDRDFAYGNLLLDTTVWKYGDYSLTDPEHIIEWIIMRGGSNIIPFDTGLHRTAFTIDKKIWYPEDIRVGCDTHRFIKALRKNVKMKYVDVNFYFYRRQNGSISLKNELRQRDLPKVVTYAQKTLDKLKSNN